ncbi:MAG TPA: patatin-like phospholipase family protein [Candidatus Dormibacteraeota bacterium]|nr:patatin-like phospholipase family protein [Candidatus Dormibacteraeota bacterium]
MAEREVAGNRPRTALVLSGGGARGAYQAGVLRGLADIGMIGTEGSPFDIIVGSSAGSINAGMLAAHADQLGAGVDRLIEVWSGIAASDVFRTDIRSLGRIGVRWAWDLSFGGALRRVQPKALLDTAPLRTLLKRIPLARIDEHVKSGALYAAAVAATDLYTSNGYLFFQGQPGIRPWKRSRWRIERTRLGIDHLMASSAIPVFFPSVRIDGRHFGDGCIRNTAPLSPAINLGAERIVAIGVQGPATEESPRGRRRSPPTIAQIAGVLLDAVMLDAIESDVEHSTRVNRSVITCRARERGDAFRWVDVLWLRPSIHIGALAAKLSDHVPPVVRYLMRGLGTDESITELLSYLLFDSAFTTTLIEAGRADVRAARAEILRFAAGRGAPATVARGGR